ncbi:uncharacterized protein DUF1653 [Luteibacter rhizovicinus]|uniref:Uncharacterized protein DUF1653 n=1 Tax=Luteibacter rhizovicinus TaxID=242606 RepID=A0A4R3YIU6_9GAMM|nr:DUF1653 domain-containing protein [Luteibacter rhizovicinus]TCV91258.1 uncharacterized protein DUF1653 [Luteibacter rhizovicinus]
MEPSLTTVRSGFYRHYKGNPYRVLGTARHSETMEELVVYQALYGDHGLWVRPAGMFAETVEIDGKVIPRFTYENDAPGFDELTGNTL